MFNKWLNKKELEKLKDNELLDEIDIKAIMEGQAESKIKSYSHKDRNAKQ